MCWLSVAAAIGLVAFASPAWPQAGETPAPVVIPTPVMPSPNARDLYSDAEDLERDNAQVGFAVGTPFVVGPDMGPRLAADPTSGYHVFSLAEKDKLVEDNLPAIAKLREGMQYKYMQPPSRSVADLFPNLARDRAMARLLLLAGQTAAEHGHWGDAMDAYLDSVKLGSDLPHGSDVIGMLVGVTCEAIGRKHAGDIIGHLSADHARADANRMAQIVANEVPVSQTLQEEEWTFEASMQTMFTGAQKARIWADDTHYMDVAIAQSKLPWPAQRSASPLVMPVGDSGETVLPPSLIARTRLKQCANLALDRLLETQLALHAYQLDHGSYPAGLADLAPGYIPAVPLDPFTDGKPLQYRLTADKYLLYSVGPDAIDDGGKPISNPSNSNNVYTVFGNLDEKGDIVAGVSN